MAPSFLRVASPRAFVLLGLAAAAHPAWSQTNATSVESSLPPRNCRSS